MSASQHSSGGLMGTLMDRIRFDWFASIAVTVMVTLLIVFSLVAGTAVWPAVFGGSAPGSPLNPLIGSVRVGALVAIIADALVAFAVMFLSRDNYSFLRGVTINLLLGWVIFMFFTAGHSEVIVSLGTTWMNGLLWGCLSVVLSYALAFLPAVITAGLAKLAHAILDSVL